MSRPKIITILSATITTAAAAAFLAVFSGAFPGCSLQTKNLPSILIIAVESLPSDVVTCSEADEPGLHGFAQICSESVRYTHAYTTSTLSLPALSSVLTGEHPLAGQITHNGENFLSAKIETAAEAAVRMGYDTAFFSGGPPVWRKSGLAQGFETFDDNVQVTALQAYRPLDRSVRLFEQWLERDAQDHPFFSVLFAPDLNFGEIATRNDIGETRAATFKGQLQEVDESLSRLVSNLKAGGRWDNTYVFVVGLNGVSPIERSEELPGTNLFSENTQVALLVKPATKKRDMGLRWKIDDAVSLVDVGATLYDLLGSRSKERSDEKPQVFKPMSLRKSFEGPKLEWERDRPVLIESGWSHWRGGLPRRWAIQKNQVLYIHDTPPRVYNSLVDRLQVIPLSRTEPAFQLVVSGVESLINQAGLTLSERTSTLDLAKYHLARRLWGKNGISEQNVEDLQSLIQRFPEDLDLMEWASYIALERRNWKFLAQSGRKIQRKDWEFVANVHLGLKPLRLTEGCFSLADIPKNEDFRVRVNQCSDPLFVEMLEALREPQATINTSLDRFIRSYRQFLVDRRVLRLNYSSGFIWDTRVNDLLVPSRVELFLALPENQRWQTIIEHKLASFESDP